jgi:hypothetical protein
MKEYIIRADGSREYLPKEYRCAPKDYYAYKIRQTKQQRETSLEMKKARVAELERELLHDLQLARIREGMRRASDEPISPRNQLRRVSQI